MSFCYQRVVDQLLDENPDALLFDNMNPALIGIARRGDKEPVAAYSMSKIYDKLLADGFSAEDAEEYFGRFPSIWAAEHTPIIVDDLAKE
jgi:hypothetical protein